VTAFIPSGRLARQILERLGVDATGPPIAKARRRPRPEHFDLHPEDPGGIRSTRTSRLHAGPWEACRSLAGAAVEHSGIRVPSPADSVRCQPATGAKKRQSSVGNALTSDARG
jgi:hypothetical protein